METNDDSGNGAIKLALTREKAAKALSMSAASLDRLADRGLIHPSRATRRPLYSVAEIERFLRETTAGPEPSSGSLGTNHGNGASVHRKEK